MHLIKNLLEDFIALIFPHTCIACQNALVKGEEQICTSCMAALSPTDYHLNPENELRMKFGGRLALHHCLAFYTFRKSSILQKIVHELKYRNNPEVGMMLGRWYGHLLKNAGLNQEFDLILPVPLHISRKIKRGYNQSDYFAEGLSEAMQVPCSAEVLIRNKATQSQTRKKRMERFQNVENIFEVLQAGKIKGQRILLVDDIVTTGSTLESCAHCIIQAGCSALSIAVIGSAKD